MRGAARRALLAPRALVASLLSSRRRRRACRLPQRAAGLGSANLPRPRAPPCKRARLACASRYSMCFPRTVLVPLGHLRSSVPRAKRHAYSMLGATHGQLLSMGLPLAALVLLRYYRMPTAAESLSGPASGRPRTFA
eukprot:4342103-Pleurochrysis_carterae.AAC.1